MSGRRPGRKSDPIVAENARLRDRVSTLEADLATATELIEAQGKVSALAADLPPQRRAEVSVMLDANVETFAERVGMVRACAAFGVNSNLATTAGAQ